MFTGKLTLIRRTEPAEKNSMLQSRYEGLARLRRRVKASDLEVYIYTIAYRA